MGRLDKKSQLRTQIDSCRGRIAGYATVISQLELERDIVLDTWRDEHNGPLLTGLENFRHKVWLNKRDSEAELKTLEKKFSKLAEKQRLKRAKKKKKLSAKKED